MKGPIESKVETTQIIETVTNERMKNKIDGRGAVTKILCYETNPMC